MSIYFFMGFFVAANQLCFIIFVKMSDTRGMKLIKILVKM